MKSAIKLLIAILTVNSLFASCKKDNEKEDARPVVYEKGYVSGIVTNTKGEPLANATIIINNTVWANKNIVLKTDKKGLYRYKMPATDTWYVRGYVEVQFNGQTYEMPLHPDLAVSFPGIEGEVVNLQWKLSGTVPADFGGGGFYGSTILLNNYTFDNINMGAIEVIATPAGTLIDGSTGQTIKRTAIETGDGYAIQDVPLGTYTITANIGNQTLYLRKQSETSPYKSNITAGFSPAYSGANIYWISLGVALQP